MNKMDNKITLTEIFEQYGGNFEFFLKSHPTYVFKMHQNSLNHDVYTYIDVESMPDIEFTKSFNMDFVENNIAYKKINIRIYDNNTNSFIYNGIEQNGKK